MVSGSMFTTDRKSSYKLPPTTIRDKLVSQEARRNKALEEQKRRRAQRIDSARQLDLFAGLNLGASDDEYDNGKNENDIEPEEAENGPVPVPGSVAHYAAMLRAGDTEISNGSGYVMQPEPVASSSKIGPSQPSASSSPLTPIASTRLGDVLESVDDNAQPPSKKKRGKNHSKRRANKASKWADRCMYAELLEMCADEPWSQGDVDGVYGNSTLEDYERVDGLPSDLETGWVAVAPVPVGKRCLAVTQQSAGVAGVVPNTTLRSRLLGKSLLARFPSALPPLTVLDCILDANWRENGILHVLDVVRWKGQDVGDCEAGFRFWWRDTRLAELTQTPPPSFHFVASTSSSASSSTNTQSYHFPYPTTFVSVPYHADTSLSALNTRIIPFARTWRMINLQLPSTGIHNGATAFGTGSSLASREEDEGGMEVETNLSSPQSHLPSHSGVSATFSKAQMPAPVARVQPDGMLLYVAEASYEPGTSPLSSWVPICLDAPAHGANVEISAQDNNSGQARREGPLDTFQTLVRRRLERRVVGAGGHGIPPQVGASIGSGSGGTGDVEMEL